MLRRAAFSKQLTTSQELPLVLDSHDMPHLNSLATKFIVVFG